MGLLFYAWMTIFLFYMGSSIWKSQPQSSAEPGKSMTSRKQVMFALSVSLLNPHAILDTIGVIGTSSIAYTGVAKWGFSAATIAVSWVWFMCLATAGRTLGRLDSSGKILVAANKISAVVVWIMAIYMVSKLW